MLIRKPENDQEQRLVDRYETAAKKIKQGLVSSKGGMFAEDGFSIAYQDLVKAGLAWQLPKKYR